MDVLWRMKDRQVLTLPYSPCVRCSIFLIEMMIDTPTCHDTSCCIVVFLNNGTRRIVADDNCFFYLQEKLTLGIHHRVPQSTPSRKEEQAALDLFVDLLRAGGANPDPRDDINVERWRKVLWFVYYLEKTFHCHHVRPSHFFPSRAGPIPIYFNYCGGNNVSRKTQTIY